MVARLEPAVIAAIERFLVLSCNIAVPRLRARWMFASGNSYGAKMVSRLVSGSGTGAFYLVNGAGGRSYGTADDFNAAATKSMTARTPGSIPLRDAKTRCSIPSIPLQSGSTRTRAPEASASWQFVAGNNAMPVPWQAEAIRISRLPVASTGSIATVPASPLSVARRQTLATLRILMERGEARELVRRRRLTHARREASGWRRGCVCSRRSASFADPHRCRAAREREWRRRSLHE